MDNRVCVFVEIDNVVYVINEVDLLKKIYHGSDFNATLPKNLNKILNDPKLKLTGNDRILFLSDETILPKEVIFEYFDGVLKHILDENTEFIKGTLGKNRYLNNKLEGIRNNPEPIQGMHCFNNITKRDVFFENINPSTNTFAKNKYNLIISNNYAFEMRFMTGMKLTKSQIEELLKNYNLQ